MARDAQSRRLLAEGAASMGRFAASVTHEIDTPLGALTSSVQLLQGLPEKRATAPRLPALRSSSAPSSLTSCTAPLIDWVAGVRSNLR
jgi:signal transduction histidine kinase